MLLAVTQVMGNKHTIRNAFPLSGEARLYRAHVKNTSNSMTMALASTFAITHSAVLLNGITGMRRQSTTRSRPGNETINDGSVNYPEHWQTSFDPSC